MKQLVLLIFLPISVFCQNTIGLPDVINYSKQSYNAGLQNWDIGQDKNGVIYVANNEGLLSFDGKNWNLYPLPNKTIVRSVEIGFDSRIYVGGQDEIGYFSPAKNGKLEYHSLTGLIPEKDKSFADVWDILPVNKDMFFRSTNKIFKFSRDEIATFNATSEWSYMGYCNGRLYAHDLKTGLMTFENNSWKLFAEKNELPFNEPVTAIMPLHNDSMLVSTLKNGLFILDKKKISKMLSPNNALFENDRIYAATVITTEQFALGTNNNGVYIIDAKGNIIQSFSKKEGLQNNNVLSIFLDNQQNLWLGLDNGIDLVAYNSAIKHIIPASTDGAGYTSIIFNNQLYAGTSKELFSVPLQEVKDLSFSKGNFNPVANTTGQNWGLAEINNQLLLGHHEGAFVIKDNKAIQISSIRGFWNFLPLSATFPVPQLIAGNYSGLSIFDYSGQQFSLINKIPAFTESSRFVALDKYDNIWVSHPYHGVFRLVKEPNGTYQVFSYSAKNGLPSILNNHVYKIKNEVAIATIKGIYVYNREKDSFELSTYYKNILGEQSVRYLKEDTEGNIWFIHEKTLGVIDLSGKEPTIIYLPELNNKLLSGFEFINPVNQNNIFLGGEKGFYHINYEKYKNSVPQLQAQIRTVHIIHKLDSLLFGGYLKNVNEKQVQDAGQVPDIDFRWKTIRFQYSSSYPGYESNLEYSCHLKGFDENWSPWSNRSEKEYTNLPVGRYTFEVKVRSNLGNESGISFYSFVILPPWYQTTLAKIIYLLFLGGIIYAIYNWQKKKFIRQQEKYEEEQRKLQYIHELERSKIESEIVALKNENLESEINFKNSEMAASAMHLVKKGELLSKIRSELTQVMKRLDNPEAIAELKKMTKSLHEDENIDKEWENFTKHFDKVHSDFVLELKEKHPTITPNELKLCAYLRMNLSTKEIAQLMNISVRGVEISRYRLRKKLQIPSEKNLFDYLINLQAKV